MADPTDATTIPHLIGVTLITAGVAYSNVIAYNRDKGERMIKATDANKRVIFDLSNFTSGYTAADVIEFENVGGSYGGATVTVNSTRVIQTIDLTATATNAFTRSM
ncbi:hypothetical protein LCGC14_0625770 [marine sediment metagenome]|uniref:Uncharacterized protein n=1 Tax=marine sediment metagenome TaxID=412755 RepID=A0A0F9UBV6_9ZZZZ